MKTVKTVEVYRAEDVMNMLQVSKTTAYNIIRKLNNELKAEGKIIVCGRVNKKYFDEKITI